MALNELKKALTSGGDGAALVPHDLDSILYEELLNLQPLARLAEIVPAEGKTHEYSVRSSHPQGWFEGESTPANFKAGAYARKSVQLKIQRQWGSVTGFAQAVDKVFIDALATELEGSLEGMSDVMEYGFLWGAANDIGFTGDPYQYSGIIPRLFSLAPSNVINAGGDKITLDDLDASLAKVVKYRQARSDPKLWFMGLRMKQVVDGLQTKVQIPLNSMELFDGKLVMGSYAGHPILETDYMTPDAAVSSPTPVATAASGGSLPNDEYFYVISSVTLYGEQTAGAEDSATTATTNNSVALTWTADPAAVLYIIWRGLATGVHQLLDIIPALTYDAEGTVNGSVETYTDNGSRTPIAVKPLKADEQNILIVDLNPRRGAAFVGKVDDMGRPIDRLFSFVELARVRDTFDYMLKGYLAMRLIHPNLVSLIRHAKLV